MPSLSPVTPLAAVDAIVLDTETTGLDARSARMIEVGAVAISGGVLLAEPVLEQRIDPGMPIPPETIAVHGITDVMVAGAPRFAEIAPKLHRVLEGRLLVGHSLAYDLAMLAREHTLAKLDWSPPRALDIRMLARIVAPDLADHGLDRLCEWLGIVNVRRHSAVGDAVATAEAFLKLVPLLRQKGIRTVAEAEQACVALSELDARTSGGLVAVVAGELPSIEAARRLDVFAYRHRVRDVMTAPAVVVPGTTTVSEIMGLMLDKGLSSVFVDLGGGITGIATERDVLRAVHGGGPAGLAAAVATIAKHPLQSVVDDDHVYRAIGRMERLGIRHLGVRDGAGAVVGALTPRNLLRNRATASLVVGDAIAEAERADQLAAAWGEVPAMAAALARDGVDARTIAAVISAEICAMTRRAAELAEAELVAAGHRTAPVAYATLVLGSAGRGESLLAADQDNAIVFDEGDPGSAADRWLERMATRMADILDAAGVALCKGGVMAKNAVWRHSRAGWEATVAGWVRRQRPQDLLSVDIFFDAAVVHGDRALGEAVLERARLGVSGSRTTMLLLSELAREWRPPIGMLGGFVKENGRVDLKKGGLMPLFTGARVLALRHGVAGRSTVERLQGLVARGVATKAQIEPVVAGHEVLLGAILGQQVEDGRKGIPLSPRVDVDRMDRGERRRLRSAIEAVATVVDLVGEGRI